MQYIYPVLVIFTWAGNTVVNKLAVGFIFPSEISFYRWLIAALILSPFTLKPIITNWKVIRPNLVKIVTLGFLGMVVYQSIAYNAAAYTSAINMGIILSLMPMIVIILSIITLGQTPTTGSFIGSLLSLLGVLLVISAGKLQFFLKNGINIGDGMMLIATLSYAIYSVLFKKWKIALPGLQLLYLQILVALVVLFPLYLTLPKTGLNKNNISLLLYASLLASIIAPLAWIKAINLLGPSRTTLFFNLIPVSTIIISSVILKEKIHMYHILGGLLTILGVLFSERCSRPLYRK